VKRISFAVLAVAMTAASNAALLWDSGMHAPVLFNGSASNLGLSSGNLGGANTERWCATPFVIATGGAHVTRVRCEGFVNPGQEFQTLNVRVYSRSGTSQPVPAGLMDLDANTAGVQDVVSVTHVGGWVGDNDTRLGFANAWQFDIDIPVAVDMALPAGEYYLTVYASDPVLLGGIPNFPWFIGAAGDTRALNKPYTWRQANLGAGFLAYSPTNIANAGYHLTNDEIWNNGFRLYGTSAREVNYVTGNVIYNDFVGNSYLGSMATGDKLDYVYLMSVQDSGNNTIASRHLFTAQQDGDSQTPVVTTLPYEFGLPVSAGDGDVSMAWWVDTWLAKKNTWTVANTGDHNTDFSLTNGNVENSDDVIDLGDFDRFAASFGSALGDANYDLNADLNGDDVVDLGDFDILAANFGSEGDV